MVKADKTSSCDELNVGDLRHAKLLTFFLKKYVHGIGVAELALKAPGRPVRPGERPQVHGLSEASTLLFLKSEERIRVQIEWVILDHSRPGGTYPESSCHLTFLNRGRARDK